jgi:hypothetical protein
MIFCYDYASILPEVCILSEANSVQEYVGESWSRRDDVFGHVTVKYFIANLQYRHASESVNFKK